MRPLFWKRKRGLPIQQGSTVWAGTSSIRSLSCASVRAVGSWWSEKGRNSLQGKAYRLFFFGWWRLCRIKRTGAAQRRNFWRRWRKQTRRLRSLPSGSTSTAPRFLQTTISVMSTEEERGQADCAHQAGG